MRMDLGSITEITNQSGTAGPALCVFIVRQDRVTVGSKLRATVYVYGKGVGFGNWVLLLSATITTILEPVVSYRKIRIGLAAESTSIIMSVVTRQFELIRLDLIALDSPSNFSAGAGDFLSGGFMNSVDLTERVLGHRAIPISQLFRQVLVAVNWSRRRCRSVQYRLYAWQI